MRENLELTKNEEILRPIAEYKPFGISSTSEKWFEYSFSENKEFPIDKRAVVILAHPDDGEDILGGTIGKLVERGFDITLVIITDGRWGIDHRNSMTQEELINKRLEETILGASELGVRKVINLGIEDREVPEDPKSDPYLLENLVDVLKKNPAGLYLTHANSENNNTKDYHADHRNTSKLTLEAIQRSRNGNANLNTQPILLYADTQGARNAHGIMRKFGKTFPRASTVDFLLDIGLKIQEKENAFSRHLTQINNTPDDILHDYVAQSREVAKFRAKQARRRFFVRPQFAEGLSIHTGQGFNTDIFNLFNKKDIFMPKKHFTRRSAPIFG
ncbi:MAG TPA: PIG-L family deacetylase [Patescibacteria group bacterium]